MRRRCVTVILSTVLLLNVVACSAGNTDATSVQSDEATETIEVTAPNPTVESVEKEVSVAERVEPEAPAVEEKTEDAEADADTKTEESVAEPTEPEVPAVEEKTEDAVADADTKAEEQTNTKAQIENYIKDGLFNVETFANDTGATDIWFGKISVILIYGNEGNIYVQPEYEEDYLPGKSSIAIGHWTYDVDWGNEATYSYIFDTGETLSTTNGITISKNALTHLMDIVNAVKANGCDTAPSVSGTDFRPCEPRDALKQY